MSAHVVACLVIGSVMLMMSTSPFCTDQTTIEHVSFKHAIVNELSPLPTDP